MWFQNKIFNREREEFGLIWSLLLTLTSFILLCVALGGLSSKGGMLDVYVAELDFSDARWSEIVSSSSQSSSYNNEFASIQRMNLYKNCAGTRPSSGKGFKDVECYRVGHENSLDMRYTVSHEINTFSSQSIDKSDVNHPPAAVISNTNSNTILVLTTIACIWCGWAFFSELFKIPWFIIPKALAVIFIFVANIMVHVLAKKMVNSLNSNYAKYGISVNLGNRYLAIVWNAFALLLASCAVQLAKGPCGLRGTCEEKAPPKFDPEAMKHDAYYNAENQGNNGTI